MKGKRNMSTLTVTTHLKQLGKYAGLTGLYIFVSLLGFFTCGWLFLRLLIAME